GLQERRNNRRRQTIYGLVLDYLRLVHDREALPATVRARPFATCSCLRSTVADARHQERQRRGFSHMGSEPGNQHRTLALAAIALGKIIELGLPADPQSYELWYAYATGLNEKLRGEIDDALQRQGKLTDSDLSRLYARYIAPSRSTGDF